MIDFEKMGVFYLGRERELGTGEPTENLLLYDSRDLTTHAVIVGMTGSGKTGLAISLLEEAAIDGLPAIAIDPKGDLGNLMLTFPQLRPEDFRPWIDEGEAQRKGLTLDQLAEQTAQTWHTGLSEWGQDPARVERLKAAVDVSIYTPGSNAGIPLSVLKSLSAPPQALFDDPDALRERVMASVSGLLSMLGINADPVRSREHILLSNLVNLAWTDGRDLDLAALIRDVQSPPMERVGVLDIESFYPAKERADLSMALNNLLASPGFATWMDGEPLDVQRLLWTPEGKPRLSIISIAHLSDAERMFFVTLLLNEVVTWMRSQAGTSSLRALLYMDEIFGYFPPVANPPSKIPMLTLFKQARAYGLGVVVATQNPVDLDYKGLANAGTWFLGRLQTERDKERVLEGLEGASASAGKAFDPAKYDELLARLGNRVFLMNNVHDDVPVLFQTRWALSYLRGPLTRSQIQTLMAERKVRAEATSITRAVADSTQSSARASVSPTPAVRPLLPPEVAESFIAWRGTAQNGETLHYRPSLLADARLHYVDTKANLDSWEAKSFLVPVPTDDRPPDWEQAQPRDPAGLELESQPDARATYDALPIAATRARGYKGWSNALEDALYRTRSLNLPSAPALKLAAQPGESEGDFHVRLQQAARERRDAEIDALRKRYAPKIQQLVDREQRAQDRVAREAQQYEQHKLQTMISIGTSVLGALFGSGRRARSARQIGRAASSVKRAGRAWSERDDIAAAEESMERIQQLRAELEAELLDELARITTEFAPEQISIESLVIRPRKSDISVERLILAWTPWWVDSMGAARPAFD
ncbi:MAG: helicase HerA domain-containing protein [Chloroflexota bacterium]